MASVSLRTVSGGGVASARHRHHPRPVRSPHLYTPFVGLTGLRSSHPLAVVSASSGPSGNNNGGTAPGGEVDLSERLRAAEEEARLLREQLADQMGGNPAAADDDDEVTPPSGAPSSKPAKPANRIDGVGQRETLGFKRKDTFTGGLVESDLEREGLLLEGWMTGNGPSENITGSPGMSDEAKQTVNRRILLGAAAIAGFAAFALIPTEQLEQTSNAPVFMQLEAVATLQLRLDEAAKFADDGNADGYRALLESMTGNDDRNAYTILKKAGLRLDDAAKRERARVLSIEVRDALDEALQYFDAMAAPGVIKGAALLANDERRRFAKTAATSTAAKLSEFARLYGREDREAGAERALTKMGSMQVATETTIPVGSQQEGEDGVEGVAPSPSPPPPPTPLQRLGW
ncbi:ubiquitin-like modifier-activating enzyme [Pycnococcus provasolii]